MFFPQNNLMPLETLIIRAITHTSDLDLFDIDLKGEGPAIWLRLGLITGVNFLVDTLVTPGLLS